MTGYRPMCFRAQSGTYEYRLVFNQSPTSYVSLPVTSIRKDRKRGAAEPRGSAVGLEIVRQVRWKSNMQFSDMPVEPCEETG